MPATSDFERMLRGASLRVTGARAAVLRAVHDHPRADTDSIIGVVRNKHQLRTRLYPAGRVAEPEEPGKREPTD